MSDWLRHERCQGTCAEHHHASDKGRLAPADHHRLSFWLHVAVQLGSKHLRLAFAASIASSGDANWSLLPGVGCVTYALSLGSDCLVKWRVQTPLAKDPGDGAGKRRHLGHDIQLPQASQSDTPTPQVSKFNPRRC